MVKPVKSPRERTAMAHLILIVIPAKAGIQGL
jgi:hypothetical protein